MSNFFELEYGSRLPYPVNLGALVAKFRRANIGGLGSKWERHMYGEAVGAAIRKLQRTELMRSLTPTPSLSRPAIRRSTSPLTVPYSEPNPFRMVGDPALQVGASKEVRLYAHSLGVDVDEAKRRIQTQHAIMDQTP
jgi:hypothetical protein